MSTAYTRGYCHGHADAFAGIPNKFIVTSRKVKEHQAAEVEWYKKNGRLPDWRISKDVGGNEYVIGDAAWSGPREVIEPAMSAGIARLAADQTKEGPA